MPAHSGLTGTDLHEPKGVAGQAAGKVYVSDGANSGSWEFAPTGWAVYQDDGSAQVFNTTPALLTNDTLGANTNTSYLPREIRGSGQLFASNRITPVALGDAYNLRIDLPITAETGSPTELTLELDIQAGSTYGGRISIVNRYSKAGKATPYTISVGFPVYCLSTFLANGAQLWITVDSGTVTITNPIFTIVRTHGEQ